IGRGDTAAAIPAVSGALPEQPAACAVDANAGPPRRAGVALLLLLFRSLLGAFAAAGLTTVTAVACGVPPVMREPDITVACRDKSDPTRWLCCDCCERARGGTCPR